VSLSCRCWSLVSACRYDDQQQKEGTEQAIDPRWMGKIVVTGG